MGANMGEDKAVHRAVAAGICRPCASRDTLNPTVMGIEGKGGTDVGIREGG